MSRRWALVLICATVCGCRWPAPKPLPAPPLNERESVTAVNLAPSHKSPAMFADRGNIVLAEQYYRETAKQLAVPYDRFRWWTLDSVFEFLGYPLVSFRDSPCDLMHARGRRRLASFRFFAPKTSTVVKTGEPSELGWRQVIRLRTTPQSEARHTGITSAFVLVNYQRPVSDTNPDPFTGEVTYFQVALVRGESDVARFPTYFLVFGPGHELKVSIRATFFGSDVTSKGEEYYVPNACLQCHGGNTKRSSLNLLDVDHWMDRVKPGDDFAIVSQRQLPVISTGNCSSAPMDVAKELNQDIRNHNRTAQVASFVRHSLDSWVDKHSDRRILDIERRAYGKDRWSKKRAGDIALLSLMNRYCYRCHGSIRFDVFNRADVLARRDRAITAIASGMMPLDRYSNQLSPDEKASLINLLRQLR